MSTKREEPPFVSDADIATAKKTNIGVYRFNTNDGNGAAIYGSGFEGGMQVCRDRYEPELRSERRKAQNWKAMHDGKEVILEEVQAEVARLRTEQEGKWISVKERLPEPEQMVLAFYEDEETGEGFMNAENYNAHHWTMTSEVTHWMPLPDPPAL